MKELQRIFEYQGRPVRTDTLNGEPIFCGKDVCEIIDVTPEQMRRLDEDEKVLHLTQTPGGIQELNPTPDSTDRHRKAPGKWTKPAAYADTGGVTMARSKGTFRGWTWNGQHYDTTADLPEAIKEEILQAGIDVLGDKIIEVSENEEQQAG